MKLALIVAMDLESGIGKDGGLPWHLSADLRRFKQITMGHVMIMGRKTYASIGRPLPGRTSVVISRNPNFEAPGCLVAESFEKSLKTASIDQSEQIFVIGGAEVFSQALPLANRLHLTLVHTVAHCQVFFPAIRWSEWRVIHQEFVPAGERDPYPSTYYVLEK